MRKLLSSVFLCLFLLLGLNLFADEGEKKHKPTNADFGFLFLNETSYLNEASGNGTEMGVGLTPAHQARQRNIIAAWLELGFLTNYNFSLGGHFQMAVNYSPYEGKYAFTPTGNLDSLNFSGFYGLNRDILKGSSFTLGRFYFNDSLGGIASLPLDGFKTSFLFETFDISIASGYTGLLLGLSNPITLSFNDMTRKPNFSQYLGSQRLIGEFKISAPDVFQNQKLDFNILFQKDFWEFFTDVNEIGSNDASTGNGGIIDTVYFGAKLSGNIGTYFSYSLNSYLSSGQVTSFVRGEYIKSPILAGLVGANVQGYFPQALRSRLNFNFKYASGDSDYNNFFEGNTESYAGYFMPITTNQREMLIFNPIVSNITSFKLAYSFKPLYDLEDIHHLVKNFTLQFIVKSFVKSSKGPLLVDGIDADSDSVYVGTEMNFDVLLLSLSDFNLGFQLGSFIPGKDLFLETRNKPKTQLRLYFALQL